MKKITKICLIVMVALVGLSSCKTSSLGIKPSYTYIELGKEDIETSARLTAEAQSMRILGIDFTRIFQREGAGFSSVGMAPFVVGGPLNYTKYQAYALHKLLLENPDYDMIMYPRFEHKKFTILGLYTVHDVKVSAKLGKLKE